VDVVGTIGGQASGIAAPDCHKAQVSILVECSRATHLFVWDGAPELQKAVSPVREGLGRCIPESGVHHTSS